MFDVNYIVIFISLLVISFLVFYFTADEKENDNFKQGMYSLSIAVIGVLGYFIYTNFIDDTLLTDDFFM